ncbi:MAG: QueT transporter family protein [Dethiobacteria bacterium]|nr:QueT transporter family protein [Dethiobacteria bacterium]
MGKYKHFNYWTRAAMIGAIYAIITIIFAPISYGMVQVRVSEMLMILPFFTPAAIPGLFVGCIIANIFGGFGLLDVIFGSLATLLSAFLVSKIANKYLAPLPPVIVNAIIIGLVLHVVLDLPLYLTILWVGFGQFIACYGLGLPLLLLLEEKKYIFE